MKAHEKWLNETLGDKEAGKFMLETADCTTIDDIVLAVSETAWRGALNWLYGKLGYSTEHEELKDIIGEELQ